MNKTDLEDILNDIDTINTQSILKNTDLMEITYDDIESMDTSYDLSTINIGSDTLTNDIDSFNIDDNIDDIIDDNIDDKRKKEEKNNLQMIEMELKKLSIKENPIRKRKLPRSFQDKYQEDVLKETEKKQSVVIAKRKRILKPKK